MAEAAVCSVAPSLHFTNEMLLSSALGKRKTPSELRLEQLKRLHSDQDQTSCSSDSNSRSLVLQKQEAPKPPRFVDTRVPDIYAATKPGDRSNKFLAKDKKDAPLFPQKCDEEANMDMGVTTVADRARSLAKFQWKKAEEPSHSDIHTGAKPSSSDANCLSFSQRTTSSPLSTFRDVTQIASGLQESRSGPAVDMFKAFKGMSSSKASNLADQTAGAPSVLEALHSVPLLNAKSQVKPSSLCIQGEKLPLDLSLKTSIRFTSSVSFERCQRMTNKDLFAGMQSFLSASGSQGNCAIQADTGLVDASTGSKVDVSFSKALHSWVHPQSVLPYSVLSTLASSAAHGGTSEREFLSKRQQMWEDSFCSLYYMFRNGHCDLFYFSTQQFLAMFIGGEFQRKDKKACTAYITRSTRGLRALLQEQDIVFTMPLCLTEVDTTIEEIQELKEFEKTHPGQTRLVDSMIAVDNSPQSVLAFNGHKNVHGLYDFLLNHRSFLSSTTGADVPVLYSPVSFQNAALVMPEVVCKQLQRPIETCESKELFEGTHKQAMDPSMNTSFVLELKGGVLPPWVVWRVCASVEQLQPGNFEASLLTDPLSGGLNIAQDYDVTASAKLEPVTKTFLKKELEGLRLSSEMRVGFMKHFKRVEGSYTVTLSTV